MSLYGKKWRLGNGILKSCGLSNDEEMDLESLLPKLLELSITLPRTARGSKDTSDFKHFKTLIKSLKVLLPFSIFSSPSLFFPPPFSSSLAAVQRVSAHFRHQTKLKQIRAKQMSSGFPRKLGRDNEVDCGRGARDATFAGTAPCRGKRTPASREAQREETAKGERTGRRLG